MKPSQFLLSRSTSLAPLTLLVAFCSFSILTSQLSGQEKSGQEKEQTTASDKQELHDKLAKYLTGTKWTGNFTMGDDKMLKDQYEILSAEKSEYGDKWNLIARIKYGNKDMTFPLPPIDIKFAGKTPVITVDKVFFPGFGTFDARVVIRKGKYGGTWQHDKVGGHMFGNITKMTEAELIESRKRVKAVKPNQPPQEGAEKKGSQ